MIPQFVPQNVCLACDGCCRFKDEESVFRPKMAATEIKELCGRLPLPEKIFAKERLQESGHLKTIAQEGFCHCTFFDLEKNTCGIYAHRPFECQLYPFLLTRRGEEVFICVHLSCPYVQEKKDSPAFQDYAARLKRYFQKKEVLEFLRRNPFLIEDYSEYKDELEEVFSLVL